MSSLARALALQFAIARRHLAVATAVAVTALVVLYVGYRHDKITQSVAYLLAMWLCSLIIDGWALWKPAGSALPVRNPRQETVVVMSCLAIGIVGLIAHFNMGDVPGVVRLLVSVALIGFMFPIAMAIIFLAKRYHPRDLGLRLQSLALALPIIAVTALVARLVAPEGLTWDKLMAETGGIPQTLMLGLISAGLAEEFARTMAQTRLATAVRNPAAGWLIATLIWALMHAPKWAASDDVIEALLGSIRIVPLGLMWGYLTFRTRSLLPAVLVHGTNFWGLQNF